ncbi:MAG TPA: zf-HC2 domain-containing protein, partial [Acidimicrobiales bacterium]|nr:zf-HC2 domain-containing protein [Acidimicrobiales bacterium]
MVAVTGACERFEGAMALAALGALPADERPGLDAHLEGCASCRETFHELTTTAGALALVDAASVAQTASVPAALTERVLGTLHRDARRARRQRVVRMGAAAGIGAVAAAVLAVVALASSPGSPAGQRVLELRGHGATATAVLTGAPWGTSVRFSEEGLPADSVYVVSM